MLLCFTATLGLTLHLGFLKPMSVKAASFSTAQSFPLMPVSLFVALPQSGYRQVILGYKTLLTSGNLNGSPGSPSRGEIIFPDFPQLMFIVMLFLSFYRAPEAQVYNMLHLLPVMCDFLTLSCSRNATVQPLSVSRLKLPRYGGTENLLLNNLM